MPEERDGSNVAWMRIAEEAERRTGILDLGGLGLTQLPPKLFELRHLRWLNLGCGIRIKRKEDFKQLGSAVRPPNKIDGQLGAIGLLSSLEASSVSGTDLGSLENFAGLEHLSWFDCSNTKVSNLEPLAGLTALQTLDCSYTQITDLEPLADLVALRMLNCSGCRLRALAPAIITKPSLRELILFESYVPKLSRDILSQSPIHNCLAAVREHFKHSTSPNNYRVFLSYAEEDKFTVDKGLRPAIESTGASVFTYHEEIQFGDKFRQEIMCHIKAAHEFVVYLTSVSVKKAWILAEIGMALTLEKRIVAILYPPSKKKLQKRGVSSLIGETFNLNTKDFHLYIQQLSERVKGCKND